MNYPAPDDTPTLPDRLSWAMKQRGLVQETLAEQAGCSQASIQKIATGKTLKSKFLPNIARALQVDVDWLELGVTPEQIQQRQGHYSTNRLRDGAPMALSMLSLWDDETPLDEDDVELPIYKEVELASGIGRSEIQLVEGRKVRFSQRTLRAAGVDLANAACATNNGNSNAPLILDRATLGIDLGMTRIIDGKIYALDHGGLLRIKFMFRLPGGGVRLRSFNREEYPDEDYTAEEAMEQGVRILGRVFWWSTLDPQSAPPLL